MSRLDEAIRNLGQTGVDYRPIGEVISALRTGLNPRQNFKLNAPEAKNYYITVRELGGFDVRRTDKTDRVDDAGLALIQNRSKLRPGDVLFSATGTIGRTALVEGEPHDWNIKEGLYAITPKTDCINPRFLIYLLHSSQTRNQILAQADGSTVASIPMATLRKVKIPVPPLEVQREIVRVLDQFTQLEAALEAELEARRRQYEHYRHSLLAFDEEVEWALLGDIATIGTGSHDTKDSVPDGEYVFYARGREPLRLDSFDFNERAIITAGDGVGVGKVFHFATGRYALHQRAYRIVPNEDVDARYVYHYLVSDFSRYLERTSVHASVTSLRRPMFLRYPVPLPPLEVQRRISFILDKFDAFVSDLSVGLPAELSARRKQYEYYRDRLLTFEERVA